MSCVNPPSSKVMKGMFAPNLSGQGTVGDAILLSVLLSCCKHHTHIYINVSYTIFRYIYIYRKLGDLKAWAKRKYKWIKGRMPIFLVGERVCTVHGIVHKRSSSVCLWHCLHCRQPLQWELQSLQMSYAQLCFFPSLGNQLIVHYNIHAYSSSIILYILSI